jgi:hypothetical protein
MILEPTLLVLSLPHVDQYEPIRDKKDILPPNVGLGYPIREKKLLLQHFNKDVCGNQSERVFTSFQCRTVPINGRQIFTHDEKVPSVSHKNGF